MHIRKDDQVEVITGDDKGTALGPGSPRCSASSPRRTRSWSRGSTGSTSTSSPAPRTSRGGGSRRRCRSPSRTSCSTARPAAAGVRVGHRFTDAGQKQRYCKVCSASLGNVGPAKPAHCRRRNRSTTARPALRLSRGRSDNGSLARPVQHDHRAELGDEVQPDQQDGDPQAGEDRHQHGRRPGHPGQGAARTRPSTA